MTLNLERIRKDFGRIASDNADSWGRGGQSTLILERIRKDFGRIASDNADSWGEEYRLTLNLERIRKDLGRIATTWKGSAKTLEGSPQLRKDPQ